MIGNEVDLLVVLGPTASGKTRFAVNLAKQLNAEIISADSRQIFKKMNIGTGKDLNEYQTESGIVSYHLIDICEPGEKYNVSRFQNDFFEVFNDIKKRGKKVILCGGTGLYIQSVLSDFWQIHVPINNELRIELEMKTRLELENIIQKNNWQHTIDKSTTKRLIRGIEIGYFLDSNEYVKKKQTRFSFHILGLNPELEIRRNRISERLIQRLKEGLVDEVQQLLHNGLSFEDLIFYGLEYKYITEYLIGVFTYDEMVSKLEIAIHQYAKRQMTFFRSMEKKGFEINWIQDQNDFLVKNY